MHDHIGTAEMRDDGTLSDAYFNVRTDDPRYEEIERHVGPIESGETKPFRPSPAGAGRPANEALEPSR